MGRNVGRLGNGLGCVPDRIYRGVSDWEDGLMSYVTVSLDDFDDDDILSAAFDIIKTAKSDSYLSDQIEAIRLILIPDNEEDSSIPPPSKTTSTANPGSTWAY